jgi:histone H3/H4
VTELASAAQTSKMTVESHNRLPWRGYGNRIFMLLVLLLLALGWYQRGDSYLEAESGLGYALGILGGSLMLLLLLYPVRKRLRAMSRVMSVGFWFRLHMLFGILGPVAILYHANFSLGSPNSSVALVCMLLVASSGLVGRYLYVRIHHGLYGARTQMAEYQTLMVSRREALTRYLSQGDVIINDLLRLEKIGQTPARGLLHSLRMRRLTRREIKNVRKRISRVIREDIKKRHRLSNEAAKVIGNSIEQYLLAVKQAADLQVHERLFGWWHVLHLPLFVMMLIAGIVHVVVVHIY